VRGKDMATDVMWSLGFMLLTPSHCPAICAQQCHRSEGIPVSHMEATAAAMTRRVDACIYFCVNFCESFPRSDLDA